MIVARRNVALKEGTVGRSWMRGTWRQRVMFAANLNGRHTWFATPTKR